MRTTNRGLFIALTIIGLWGLSLFLLLTLDVAALIPVGILCQTFLYTGLFITAHDAMHGSVCPAHPRLNNSVGTIAVGLYALFSYRKLLKKHWAHHRTPASDTDPDYHDGEHSGFWGVVSPFHERIPQRVADTRHGDYFSDAGICFEGTDSQPNSVWVIPALLSTLQLFYFGTYLPHRLPVGGYDNPHHAQSNAYATFWSFITCYHFGYHWEHHEYPYVPWWQLPTIRKAKGLPQ